MIKLVTTAGFTVSFYLVGYTLVWIAYVTVLALVGDLK